MPDLYIWNRDTVTAKSYIQVWCWAVILLVHTTDMVALHNSEKKNTPKNQDKIIDYIDFLFIH